MPQDCKHQMRHTDSSDGKYSFLICRGNYSNVVREALARRSWWKDIVFEKCPPQQGMITAGQRKLQNERHDAIAMQELELQEFDLLWKPVARVRLRAAALSTNLGVVKRSDLQNVTASGDGNQDKIGTVHSIPLSTCRDYTTKPQMVNHLPNGATLTTKPGLKRSMCRYYRAAGLNPFHAIPTTFLVNSSHKDDPGWSAFSTRFRQIAHNDYSQEDMPAKHCSKNMWIVKPPNSNQGQGIRVFSKLSKIKAFVNSEKHGGCGNEWVVQKYLESPLLLWGRKFDIRVWVLVTNDFEILMYRQGYLRTSSSVFTTETLHGDPKGVKAGFVHLTNFCMQKHSPSVGKYEDGNTLSFGQFQEYIDTNFEGDGISLEDHILPKMKSLVVDSLLAARSDPSMKDSTEGQGLLGGNMGRKQFELFGYDFMIDEDFRPWLIEVNTNPYLGTQNEWHGNLVKAMIEDMVCTAIDPLFPPPAGSPTVKLPTVFIGDPKNTAWKLGFEMLWSEKRKHVQIAGVCSLEERQQRQLSWYYDPVPVPLPGSLSRHSVQEKRKHINSRDRAVTNAKIRIGQRKKRDREKNNLHEKEYEESMKRAKEARRKLRDQSRLALRDAIQLARQQEKLRVKPESGRTTSRLKHASPTNWRNCGEKKGENSCVRNIKKMNLVEAKVSDLCQAQKMVGEDKVDTLIPLNQVRNTKFRKVGISSLRKGKPPVPQQLKISSGLKIPDKRTPTREDESEKQKSPLALQNFVTSPVRVTKRTHVSSRKLTQTCDSPKQRPRSHSINPEQQREPMPKASKSDSKIKERRSSRSTRRLSGKVPIKLRCVDGQRRETLHGLPSINNDRAKQCASGRSTRRKLGFDATRRTLMPCDVSWTSSSQTANVIKESSSLSNVRLSKDILQSRREEVLALVMMDCNKDLLKAKQKEKMISNLKARQMAWVKENLKRDKFRFEQASARHRERKEKEKEIHAVKEKEMQEMRREKYLEMRRNWLRRQKDKKLMEDLKQKKLLEQQQLLDHLSLQRQEENKVHFDNWMRLKKMKKKIKIKNEEAKDKSDMMCSALEETKYYSLSKTASPIRKCKRRSHILKESSAENRLGRRMNRKLHGFEDLNRDMHSHMG